MGAMNFDSIKPDDEENYPSYTNYDISEDSLKFYAIYNQNIYNNDYSFLQYYSSEQYLENNNNDYTITHNYTNENSKGNQPENKNTNNVNMDIEKEDNNTIYEQDNNKNENNMNNMNNNQGTLFDINQQGTENNLVNELEALEEEQRQNDTKIELIKEKDENIEEKDNAHKIVFCKGKQIPKEKDGIQKKESKICMVKKSSTQRMFKFNLAKDVIYNKCGSNTIDSINLLLILLGVDEDLIILTTDDKFGHSYKSNRNFFLREIGDLISNSYCRNVKISKKGAKKGKIEKILKQEMKDKTIELKAINAIFNLIFLDFLYAFLEDQSVIIIKNDYNDNNKTKVFFYKSDQLPPLPYYKVKFVTYKDCFNDKYTPELKQSYKEKIFQVIRGQLRKVGNDKNYKLLIN